MPPRRLASPIRVVTARRCGRLLLGAALVLGSVAASAAKFTPLGDLPGGAYRSEFGALSADGRTVVGWSTSANGKEAFRWSLAGGMTGLGDLPGGTFESTATAVSADGSVVTGSSLSANGSEAFRWTAAGGMAGLGDLPGGAFSSQATGISADGGVVVGNGVSTNGAAPFRWTAAGGLAGLAGITGSSDYGSTKATGVSDDGNVVVGGVVFSPFRWTASGIGLWFGQGLPGGPWPNLATAVSADGNVVVGRIGIRRNFSPGFTYEGFRTTFVGDNAVATRLGLLEGYNSSEPYAVSADGSTVVGTPAFRWTAATGMISLGDLPGGFKNNSAHSVSADGSRIVGYCLTSGGLKTFVWTAATGMRSLEAVLLSKGVDPASGGWTAFAVAKPETATVSTTMISPDGRHVAGTGTHNGNTEAFLADLKAVVVPTPVLTATFAGGAVTLRWDPAFSAVQQVLRAAKPEGPFAQVATGALAGTYTETPPAGAGQYYRVIWP